MSAQEDVLQFDNDFVGLDSKISVFEIISMLNYHRANLQRDGRSGDSTVVALAIATIHRLARQAEDENE